MVFLPETSHTRAKCFREEYHIFQPANRKNGSFDNRGFVISSFISSGYEDEKNRKWDGYEDQ